MQGMAECTKCTQVRWGQLMQVVLVGFIYNISNCEYNVEIMITLA